MGIKEAILKYREECKINTLYRNLCNEIYDEHIKKWHSIIKRVIDINNADMVGLVRRDRFDKIHKFSNRKNEAVYACALMYITVEADEKIDFYDNEWREYTENYEANKVIFEAAGRLAAYNKAHDICFIEFAIESFFGYGVTVNAIVGEKDIKEYFMRKGARNQWELKLLTKLRENEDLPQKGSEH